MLKHCPILLIAVILTSCGNSIKSLSGTYVLDQVPKTRLILNANNTFIFIKLNENPYLFTSDHINQRFYITKGQWDLLGSQIILTSSKDSQAYDLVKIVYDTTHNLKYSRFRFFDIYEDSIGSGPILYPDSTQFVKGGAGRKADFYSFGEDMTKTGSLEFIFYGYGPWKYVPEDTIHHDMIIHFMPVFKPNVFDKTAFNIHGRTLVEPAIKRAYKFRKVKKAGIISVPGASAGSSQAQSS